MSDSDYSEASKNNSSDSDSDSDATPPQRQRKIARKTDTPKKKQPTTRVAPLSNSKSQDRVVQSAIAEAIESTTGIADVEKLSDLFDQNVEVFGKPNTTRRETSRNTANYWRFQVFPKKPERYLELLFSLGVTPFALRPENQKLPLPPKKKGRQAAVLTPSPKTKKRAVPAKKSTKPCPLPPTAAQIVFSPIVARTKATKKTKVASPSTPSLNMMEDIDETRGECLRRSV